MSAGDETVVIQVVSQFDEIVKPDGGSVSFVSADDGVLRVHYAPGTNEECAACVMSPDALAGMIKDMVISLDPSIKDVVVQS
jgi:Fe-S cluster biogenesis protein NfuA